MALSLLKRYGGIAVGLSVAMTLAACGGTTQGGDDAAATGGSTATADPEGELQTGLTFAMLPKQVNNPYFETSSAGAEKAVGELEGEYEYTGPSEASASSQVSYINTLSQQGTNVILLSANDPNALCSSLEQARTGGA